MRSLNFSTPVGEPRLMSAVETVAVGSPLPAVAGAVMTKMLPSAIAEREIMMDFVNFWGAFDIGAPAPNSPV